MPPLLRAVRPDELRPVEESRAGETSDELFERELPLALALSRVEPKRERLPESVPCGALSTRGAGFGFTRGAGLLSVSPWLREKRPLDEWLSAWLSDDVRDDDPPEDELRPKDPLECEDDPDEWFELDPPNECPELDPPELWDDPELCDEPELFDEPPPKPLRPASTVVAEAMRRPVTKRAEVKRAGESLSISVPRSGDAG